MSFNIRENKWNRRFTVRVTWDANRSECRVTVSDKKRDETILLIAQGDRADVTRRLKCELRKFDVSDHTIMKAFVGVFENDDRCAR